MEVSVSRFSFFWWLSPENKNISEVNEQISYFNPSPKTRVAQSAGVIEYTDSTSAEG